MPEKLLASVHHRQGGGQRGQDGDAIKIDMDRKEQRI